jgi:F-type H+-transporting ATPase subunit delta
VEDELFRFARTLEARDELRTTLTDAALPVSQRQQIVEDLLGGKAHAITTSLVSMVVGTGRSRDLPAIIAELVRLSAAEGNKEVAEVRSAIALTDDQKARLAEALGQATGKQVEVKVVIDPTVLGGLVAQVGDTVIDGSVRTRLDQLKTAF